MVPNWESTKPSLCIKFPLDATTKHSWIIFIISESFPMSYCMTLYLKEYHKCNRSKLKLLHLLSEFRSFNIGLSYFWSPIRCRVIQCLIKKLSDMVNMIQEGKVVAALSTSIRTSWNVGIHYINRALMILNLAQLYI